METALELQNPLSNPSDEKTCFIFRSEFESKLFGEEEAFKYLATHKKLESSFLIRVNEEYPNALIVHYLKKNETGTLELGLFTKEIRLAVTLEISAQYRDTLLERIHEALGFSAQQMILPSKEQATTLACYQGYVLRSTSYNEIHSKLKRQGSAKIEERGSVMGDDGDDDPMKRMMSKHSSDSLRLKRSGSNELGDVEQHSADPLFLPESIKEDSEVRNPCCAIL